MEHTFWQAEVAEVCGGRALTYCHYLLGGGGFPGVPKLDSLFGVLRWSHALMNYAKKSTDVRIYPG